MNPLLNRRPMGSIDRVALFRFAEGKRRLHQLDIQPQLPPKWSVKIGKYKYSEMWIRLYAFMRHFHGCMAMSSDYANKATEVYHPIVRCRKRDLQLLEANTKLAKLAKKPIKCLVPERTYY